nr:hypothetical protein CFP56_03882 [Quercus suber]
MPTVAVADCESFDVYVRRRRACTYIQERCARMFHVGASIDVASQNSEKKVQETGSPFLVSNRHPPVLYLKPGPLYDEAMENDSLSQTTFHQQSTLIDSIVRDFLSPLAPDGERPAEKGWEVHRQCKDMPTVAVADCESFDVYVRRRRACTYIQERCARMFHVGASIDVASQNSEKKVQETGSPFLVSNRHPPVLYLKPGPLYAVHDRYLATKSHYLKGPEWKKGLGSIMLRFPIVGLLR